MKTTISILFFFSVICGYAQSDSLGRFALGVKASIGSAHRIMTPSESYSEVKSQFDELESRKIGHAIGGIGMYNLNKKWWVISGLQFSNLGYRIDSLLESGIHAIEYNNYYVGIPLEMKFVKETNTSVKPSTSVGIIGSYLFSQKTRYKEIVGNRSRSFSVIENLNRIQLEAIVSIGIQANVVDGFVLAIDAHYRQAFTSISNGDINRYLNYSGVSFSILKSI